PLYNRYDVGMRFNAHVDNAIRHVSGAGARIRTDVSSTLFLTAPEDYDGGELVIQDTFGEQRVKLPAGDMILYPATSLHRVEPITRGSRWASFFWTQSLVKSDAERALLYDLDLAIQSLRAREGESAELLSLTNVYHNLLRRFAEL
ncbi:MAG TPA: Fe2+-dependent dioxygenase, partial [Caulobacterales bacterium]|nr:Fe2+-dependent dioxygenase [Caulobacterales bacterium]